MASDSSTQPADLPVLLFRDAAEWERWLEAHAEAPGLWLKIAKKDSGVASVNYQEALDVALCHGWIDGLKRSLDDKHFLQRFTPRKPRSLWSKINIGKVEQLTVAGRMKPGGLREVERARADGRWDAAYASARTIEVPDDLKAALAKKPKARAFFEQLDKTNRYAVLWRVHTARKPETRTARIEKLVVMLGRGEKIHG